MIIQVSSQNIFYFQDQRTNDNMINNNIGTLEQNYIVEQGLQSRQNHNRDLGAFYNLNI